MRRRIDRRWRVGASAALLALAGWVAGCKTLAGRPSRFTENDVVVIATPHADYLRSEAYDLRDLDAVLRAYAPDIVLCQIPPDRFEEAWQEYVLNGRVEEEHVRGFPEVEGVLFPLARQGRMVLMPCSGWSPEVIARRDAQLEQWQTTRPDDTREVNRALERAETRLRLEGLRFDSMRVHTPQFDEIVAEGFAPYERLFDRDLGPGGWGEINRAHHTLISNVLSNIAGRDLRIAIVFGAEHKGKLRALLAGKGGMRLRRLSDFVQIDAAPER